MIGVLPLVGLISGVTLLFSTRPTGSFDFIPGLKPGIRVFIVFCGISLFLVVIRCLLQLTGWWWGKGSVFGRSMVYLIVGAAVYIVLALYYMSIK